MKRHTIAVLVGFATFLLGLLLTADWYPRPSGNPDRAATVTPEARPVSGPATCRENSSSFPGLSRPTDSISKYKNGYFPKKAFDDGWRGADGSFESWYGKHLRVMGERSLLDNRDADTETYRFLWLRTFHHPISVRIERTGYSVRLTSVELDGAGGYEPGRKLRTDNIEIYRDQWCHFTSLLDAAKFWSQPTVDPDLSGFDGSQWILEGVNDERYHIVDRWTPRDGGIREACIYLLKLSGRDEKSLEGNLY